jgi:hypothetical protein
LIALQYHEVKINITFASNAELGTNITTDFSNASLWVDYIFLDTDERRRFAQLSHEYLIEQLQYTGEESTSAGNATHKLALNHPVKELVWCVQRSGLSAVQWTAFTTSAGANMVNSAKLMLNGHDRFAERDGAYFNLVQPFQHHERVPANRGINVYSFALKPEEHQPSGTLNMSRIDTANLKLNNASSAEKVKIFATNYNVLRIMSGMGGLAYSYLVLSLRVTCRIYSSSICGKTVRHSTITKSVASLAINAKQHTWLSGNPLEILLPCVVRKRYCRPRLIAVPKGKNARYWAIRRSVSYIRNGFRDRKGVRHPRDVVRYDPSPLGNLGVARQQLSYIIHFHTCYFSNKNTDMCVV